MNEPNSKKPARAKAGKSQPLPVQTLIKAAVDVAKGVSRRRIIAENDNLPERLIRELQRSGMGEAEFRRRFQAELEQAAAETLAVYRAELRAGRIPASNLSVSLGILVDKVNGLVTRNAMETFDVAAAVSWTGHKSKAELIAILRGEQWPPLLAQPRDTSQSVLPTQP